MEVHPLSPDRHPAVRTLLARSNLPVKDLHEGGLTRFFGVEADGELAGVIGLEAHGRAGLLRSLAVGSHRRGRGLGQALVAHLERAARREGISDLWLLTTTAELFFRALGYQVTPREKAPEEIRNSSEFREVCPSTAVCMHRHLGTAAEQRVLVLCTGNSARSQIAEALLARKGAGRFEVVSAGSRPASRVNPWAVRVLAENGIEWEGRVPKGLDGLDRERWDFVITVCDRAKEACPIFPGTPVLAHWGMPDPAEVEGGDADKLRAFRETYLVLNRRIDLLLALPAEKLERLALERAVRAIGAQ
jgi:protein-tyrosine-phosphatase/N-acetylglutamate synthase-like GNAT family acetyltransferase